MREEIYACSTNAFTNLPIYGAFELHSLPGTAVKTRNALLEHDTRYLQVIPYCVVTCGDFVLMYQRSGTEARLHDLWSIGFGGHWNVKHGDVVLRSALIELEEELGLDPEETSRHLDYLKVGIYDATTPVGAVHVGVLMRANLQSQEQVKLPSEEIKHHAWAKKTELFEAEATLENWSKIALQVLPALGVI
jgi:predicted NUDIX family phosphoesterase